MTLAAHASDPTTVSDPDGVPLADGTTRTLLCDPALRPLVVDSLGVPLDLGRTVRYATAGQRRATAMRDGGCVFPGCDSPPSWCDQHHIHDFATGGATDLAVLASLCRHHHNVMHRDHWTMTATGDGWFSVTSPSGRQFETQRHQRTRSPDQQAA